MLLFVKATEFIICAGVVKQCLQFIFLVRKAEKSNRLQMSLQRQQFLLTERSSPLSVGAAKGIKLSMVHGISVCSCVLVSFDIFKTMPFLHSGSQAPGEVTVTVITDSGRDLGFTFFKYVDDMEDLLKQLVKDRFLQARYFAMLSTEFAFGNVTSGSNISEVQGLENVPDHGKTAR